MVLNVRKGIICIMKSFLSRGTKNALSSKFSFVAILFISCLAYILISLGNVTRSGLWFDESFSAYLTRFNLIDITKYTAADVHPPMYYWLLKIWSLIFGQSELALRSLSIAFGVLAILIAAKLISKMFGRGPGSVSVILMALSPMFLRYGDEARMYTLVVVICLAATYVLIEAVKTNRRAKWTQYGLLVALGMWTHYFTAVVWISHWIWRYLITRKNKKAGLADSDRFFSKNWVYAYGLAIVLFLAWLPFMILQLGGIQVTNFWIGPVGINSFTNFLTNTFYYQEYQQVINWQAAALIFVIIFMIVSTRIIYRRLEGSSKDNYLMLLTIAIASPMILFVVSLPPLKSSFVERYLLTASVSLALLMGVNIYYMFKNGNRMLSLSAFLVVISIFTVGIQNVYFYGNYNKNSSTYVSTRDVVYEINKRSMAGEPIIAQSPWTYYEAVPYQTGSNQVYFVSSDTDYKYGSLVMLKENSLGKITDINAFIKQHPVFWYIGYSRDGQINAPYPNICAIDRFAITDRVDGRTDYKAVKYRYCG